MVGLILGVIAVLALLLIAWVAYLKPGPDQNRGLPPDAKEGEVW